MSKILQSIFLKIYMIQIFFLSLDIFLDIFFSNKSPKIWQSLSYIKQNRNKIVLYMITIKIISIKVSAPVIDYFLIKWHWFCIKVFLKYFNVVLLLEALIIQEILFETEKCQLQRQQTLVGFFNAKVGFFVGGASIYMVSSNH